MRERRGATTTNMGLYNDKIQKNTSQITRRIRNPNTTTSSTRALQSAPKLQKIRQPQTYSLLLKHALQREQMKKMNQKLSTTTGVSARTKRKKVKQYLNSLRSANLCATRRQNVEFKKY